MRFVWISAMKDLRMIIRDPFSTLTWIGVPLCIGLLIHLVFGGQDAVPQGRLLVADQDGTIVSNLLVSAFSREPLSRMFHVEAVEAKEGRARLDRGEVSALLTIPKGLQDSFLRNQPCKLQLLTNPAQRILPKMIAETLSMMVDGAFYVQHVAGSELRSLDTEQAPGADAVSRISTDFYRVGQGLTKYLQPPAISLQTAVVAEPKASVSTASFFFPNMLFMGLLLMANGLAGEIWRERTRGTLRRLAVSPASTASFLGGKLLMVMLLYVAVSVVGVGAARWMVGAQVTNLAAAVLWCTLAGTAFYLAMMLIAMAASSERTAHVLGNMLTFPLAMVGGCFFPFEVMPDWLASIGKRTPNGWAVVQFKAILAGSLDASHAAVGVAAMVAGIAVVFVLCTRQLRRGFLT